MQTARKMNFYHEFEPDFEIRGKILKGHSFVDEIPISISMVHSIGLNVGLVKKLN